MRVLLISADFPPIHGGLSNYLFNLIRQFPEKSVVVLAPRGADCESVDRTIDFNVYRRRCLLYGSIPGKILKVVLFFFHSLSIIKREKVEALLCGQLLTAGFVGYLIKKLFKLPYFIFLFGSEYRSRKRFGIPLSFMLTIMRNADGIIACSESVRNEYIRLGAEEEMIETIYPGIDCDRFRPISVSPEYREHYGLAGKKVMLTVSRLARSKGIDLVIRAIPKVAEKINNLVYLIAGRGPEERSLQSLVRELNLDERVRFLGYLPDAELPLYYNICDLFILPSTELKDEGLAEGFGIVLLEAGACAKPVIGGRSGGTSEAIVDGRTGLLVDSTDVDEVSRAITRLLLENEYARRLGQAGRERARKEFSWKGSASKLRQLIERASDLKDG